MWVAERPDEICRAVWDPSNVGVGGAGVGLGKISRVGDAVGGRGRFFRNQF